MPFKLRFQADNKLLNGLTNRDGNDKLNFEIRDFVIEKGGENLQATFVVKGVPINSKSLSSVPVSSAVYSEE